MYHVDKPVTTYRPQQTAHKQNGADAADVAPGHDHQRHGKDHHAQHGGVYHLPQRRADVQEGIDMAEQRIAQQDHKGKAGIHKGEPRQVHGQPVNNH